MIPSMRTFGFTDSQLVGVLGISHHTLEPIKYVDIGIRGFHIGKGPVPNMWALIGKVMIPHHVWILGLSLIHI